MRCETLSHRFLACKEFRSSVSYSRQACIADCCCGCYRACRLFVHIKSAFYPILSHAQLFNRPYGRGVGVDFVDLASYKHDFQQLCRALKMVSALCPEGAMCRRIRIVRVDRFTSYVKATNTDARGEQHGQPHGNINRCSNWTLRVRKGGAIRSKDAGTCEKGKGRVRGNSPCIGRTTHHDRKRRDGLKSG